MSARRRPVPLPPWAPVWSDDFADVYAGDCVVVLAALPDASVDAVVTDPPYGIGFMGKAWDQPGAFGSSRRVGSPGVHRRGPDRDDDQIGDTGALEAGRYDLSPQAMHNFQGWCTLWASQCLRVLKPGGHLLAFGGSRTWHRLASGIEDAGFEVRDSIAWLYGTGFPKSKDVSGALDDFLAGSPMAPPADPWAPPEVYRITMYLRAARDAAGWTNRRIDALFGTNGMAGHWTSNGSQPAVPSVAQWERLKAELGPHLGDDVDGLVERFAATERPEDWGRGGGDRGPFLGTLRKGGELDPPGGWGTALKPSFEPIVVARKPVIGSTTANVRGLGTGGLNIDGCRVATTAAERERMDAGSVAWNAMSERRGRTRADGSTIRDSKVYGTYGACGYLPADAGRWPPNVVLDEAMAVSLDGVTVPSVSRVGRPRAGASGDGWGMSATGAEYADEGGPSRFFPVFRWEAKAPTSERPSVDGVQHPTVKPVDLMRWLVRLVTPPGGVVVEPFAGSGTTIEAALVEGFECIGIERDPSHLPLIRARLAKPLQPVLGFDLGEVS